MTRWVNLGQGHTKEDPLWKSRVQIPNKWNRVSLGTDDPEHFPIARSHAGDLRTLHLIHSKIFGFAISPI
jgi:hypothetical protein